MNIQDPEYTYSISVNMLTKSFNIDSPVGGNEKIEVKLEILDRPSLGMFGCFIVASIIGFCGNCVILAVIVGTRKFRM
jgi:hypothetical protein